MSKKSLQTPDAPASDLRKVHPARDITEAQLRDMPESAYMNDTQLAFFRYRLLRMRQEALAREACAKRLLNQPGSRAQPADRATSEKQCLVYMHLREREAGFLAKIDEALARIGSRDYGYCTRTGEAIGIARLLKRPTASVCVDMKEQQERGAQQRG